jgi:hypothetical protein
MERGVKPVDSSRILGEMKQEAPSSAPKETGRGSSLMFRYFLESGLYFYHMGEEFVLYILYEFYTNKEMKKCAGTT